MKGKPKGAPHPDLKHPTAIDFDKEGDGFMLPWSEFNKVQYNTHIHLVHKTLPIRIDVGKGRLGQHAFVFEQLLREAMIEKKTGNEGTWKARVKKALAALDMSNAALAANEMAKEPKEGEESNG